MHQEILLSAIKGYRKMEAAEDEGLRPVNRPAWEGRHERQIKKMTAAKDWYKPTAKKADATQAHASFATPASPYS